MNVKPTVFLDRDGTINVDTEYLTNPDQMKLLPGAALALGMLKRAGYSLVLVSNQSAIGRGYCRQADVDAVNLRMEELLLQEDEDAKLDAIFFCPHTPEAGCACRKPATGLVQGHWDYEAARSWMVGDKLIDLEFGHNLGLPATHLILVQTGKGPRDAKQAEAIQAKARFSEFRPGADLFEAAHLIAAASLW